MKVVSLGEILLRLEPEGYLRFLQADRFQVMYGGSEANVAISLANFGVDTTFVTKLPENEIGQQAINSIRQYGVDTSHVVRGGERIGIYFLEKGASQRPSKVIYDRKNSAFSLSDVEEYDWDAIFSDAGWFHFSGITPALNEKMIALTRCAIQQAKKRNIIVSCDVNYREKLWDEKKASLIMKEFMEQTDVCIVSSDGAGILGVELDEKTRKDKRLSAEIVAEKLYNTFNLKYVAVTLRQQLSANDNSWAGMIYDGRAHYSKQYDMHIVDRVGGGDSFSAGIIYALLKKYPLDKAIEFAVAASCLKHSIEGDCNLATVEEVEFLANGQGNGQVQR